MDRYRHDGLEFDVTDAGPPDGPVVILLHGFPEDRSSWDGVTPALNSAGWRTLAPDQRGYSPGASPESRRSYSIDRLAADVLALADAAGASSFHLVGHDWGAGVGWYLAAHHGDRVATWTALSVPHPRAFAAAMLRSTQALRSWYMLFFQLPWLPERLLGRRRGAFLADGLTASGLSAATAARYAARARTPAGLRGPVNWYRAIPFAGRAPLPVVGVPTLFVWGDRDRFVSGRAALSCQRHVAGPFRAERLRGVSHWIPEEEPARTAELILGHIGSPPG